MNPARWTKTAIALFTGINSWCALYLESERQIAGIAVVLGAVLVWLAPNQPDEPDQSAHIRRETSGNTP